jgi:hypothetical protein
MNPEIANKNVNELTNEELDQLVKDRQRKAKADKVKKELAYQAAKNELVNKLVHNAQGLSDLLKEFKDQAFDQLNGHYQRMKEYGDVKEGHKGNFQLKSEDGEFKVEFTNQIIKEFDERADMAAEHLNEFLLSHVKKRSKADYNMIKTFIEKKNDKFDVSLVGRLYQMEDNYEDQLWKKAIELFRVAYVEVGSAYYVRFFKRNDQSGQWEAINLNFASV